MATPRPKNRALTTAEPAPRYETMKASGIVPQLPPAPLPYMIEWLFEIGPTIPGGMSPAPIGWRDMEAWQSIVGVELLPWEGKLLRQLSAEFVNMSFLAKEPDCPPPWAPDREVTVNRDAVSRKLGNAFRAMVEAQTRGRKR